ncbi:hypothetical protein HBN65_10270 [Pseudomonas lundensis]|nr:hypothetical protein [Pseudomonas lundensis]
MKKSAMVSTVEKHALEIEIFTLNRGFRAQISRSSAQKMVFSAVSMRTFWKDFFNRIGWKLPAECECNGSFRELPLILITVFSAYAQLALFLP